MDVNEKSKFVDEKNQYSLRNKEYISGDTSAIAFRSFMRVNNKPSRRSLPFVTFNKCDDQKEQDNINRLNPHVRYDRSTSVPTVNTGKLSKIKLLKNTSISHDGIHATTSNSNTNIPDPDTFGNKLKPENQKKKKSFSFRNTFRKTVKIKSEKTPSRESSSPQTSASESPEIIINKIKSENSSPKSVKSLFESKRSRKKNASFKTNRKRSLNYSKSISSQSSIKRASRRRLQSINHDKSNLTQNFTKKPPLPYNQISKTHSYYLKQNQNEESNKNNPVKTNDQNFRSLDRNDKLRKPLKKENPPSFQIPIIIEPKKPKLSNKPSILSKSMTSPDLKLHAFKVQRSLSFSPNGPRKDDQNVIVNSKLQRKGGIYRPLSLLDISSAIDIINIDNQLNYNSNIENTQLRYR